MLIPTFHIPDLCVLSMSPKPAMRRAGRVCLLLLLAAPVVHDGMLLCRMQDAVAVTVCGYGICEACNRVRQAVCIPQNGSSGPVYIAIVSWRLCVCV